MSQDLLHHAQITAPDYRGRTSSNAVVRQFGASTGLRASSSLELRVGSTTLLLLTQTLVTLRASLDAGSSRRSRPPR